VKKIFLITLLTFFVFAQFVGASVERELKIFKNIRCLVCQGQSLNDSNSDFAIDLKKVIKKKIVNNQTDREIYKYLTDRYGDWILFDPPLKMKTILLWILPFLFILMGGALIYKKTINIKKKE
jgi:cytochrome c-type biogenesis protein CcmH|tara:strand:+ start:1146 stop:1514 length:369 start_codon:yes stop_codon:yes gene_type:complete